MLRDKRFDAASLDVSLLLRLPRFPVHFRRRLHRLPPRCSRIAHDGRYHAALARPADPWSLDSSAPSIALSLSLTCNNEIGSTPRIDRLWTDGACARACAGAHDPTASAHAYACRSWRSRLARLRRRVKEAYVRHRRELQLLFDSRPSTDHHTATVSFTAITHGGFSIREIGNNETGFYGKELFSPTPNIEQMPADERSEWSWMDFSKRGICFLYSRIVVPVIPDTSISASHDLAPVVVCKKRFHVRGSPSNGQLEIFT